MRAIVRSLAMVVAAGTVVSCGDGPHSAADSAGPAAAQARWTSCAVDAVAAPDPVPPAGADASPGADGRNGAAGLDGVPDGADATSLPRLGDFVATAAVVCSQEHRRRPGGGEDLVAVEARAEDITALAAALRLPDERRTDAMCTMDLPTVPWFALLDQQGRWMRPGLPVDSCGKIRIEVRDAVRALTLVPVSSRMVREIESAEAAAAGCSQGWSDMISVERGQPSTRRAALDRSPLAAATRVRLCAYRVADSERGTGKPSGTFEYGTVLPAQRLAAIQKSLLAAGPAKPCARHASRFALLSSADGGAGEVYVELDGCQWIMSIVPTGRPVLAQGDAALTALLGAK